MRPRAQQDAILLPRGNAVRGEPGSAEARGAVFTKNIASCCPDRRMLVLSQFLGNLRLLVLSFASCDAVRGEPGSAGRWHETPPRRLADSPLIGPETRLQSPHEHRLQTHPQLLHHRPHRPRQEHAGRPAPRKHGHGREASPQGADARRYGAGAAAGHHDQGPGRPHGIPA